MAYRFPRTGTRAASHITPHTYECLDHPERLPTLNEAKAYCRRYFETTQSGATGLYHMTLLANDNVALCFYGIRGGFRVVWDFGRA